MCAVPRVSSRQSFFLLNTVLNLIFKIIAKLKGHIYLHLPKIEIFLTSKSKYKIFEQSKI